MTVAATLPHDWYAQPLPPNVALGEGTWLYSAFAFLHCRSRRPRAVEVGRSCGIYNGSFFELGVDGEVRIGDFCALVGVTIATNGRVRMGDYCFVAHEVVIADTPFPAPPPAGPEGVPGAREPECCVELGDDVWVGAGAVLLKGARLRDGAVVGAGCVVDFEVPPRGIVAGNPARLVGFTGQARTR